MDTDDFDINNELNNIIDIINNNMNDLTNYKINKIIKFKISLIELFINNLTDMITFTTIKLYKFTNYKKLFEFIIRIILNTNTDLEHIPDFIEKLSCLDKGQFLLESIKNRIEYSVSRILNILKIVAAKGTLPIYLFWESQINIDNSESYYDLLYESLKNNDNRTFKYLLKRINTHTICNISVILLKLYQTNHKNNIIYKKIKLLSNYFDFTKNFNILLEAFNNNIKIFFDLEKYYYKTELTFNIIYKIYYYISNIDELNKFYNTLKTVNEKNSLLIINSLKHNYTIQNLKLENILNLQFSNINNILDIHSLSLIDTIVRENIDKSHIINKYIYKYYYTNKLFEDYLNNNNFVSNINILLYTKFYVYKIPYEINIKYNKALHILRCCLKKKYNNKQNYIKLNYQPVINELITYKPNKTKLILNKGSTNYQVNKVKFTTIPPRHILPYEINLLNQYLIKEKSDGILVNTLPINIYPSYEDIMNYSIKAEYIEHLNLYLVFDIDLPNTTIIERQSYLRIIHPFTGKLNNFQTVETMDDLIANINYERNNIVKYLEIKPNEIKWYPKSSFKVNKNNNEFINHLNEYIEEVNPRINNFINKEGIIKNDGLIITLLDQVQELKIKPKSLMTIDLLYRDNKWIDSSNKIWKNVINVNKITNNIYRCYPVIKNNSIFYIPHEIRYDKNKPNNNKICSLISNLFQFNWIDRINYKNYYYENNNKIIDSEINKFLLSNKNFLLNLINDISPVFNKNWLDLGCGKCKFYENIKFYNPKVYVGIDSDIKCIIKSNMKYNNIDNLKLYQTDLNNNWNITNYNITNMDWTIKYDYILANFSLMHFCSNLFWEQLDTVVNNNCIFIFNIVKENSNWNYKNNYLKSNNNQCVIHFDWVHSNEQTEKIINKHTLDNYFLKYNWKVLHIIKNNDYDLTKCYNWYIIQKMISKV